MKSLRCPLFSVWFPLIALLLPPSALRAEEGEEPVAGFDIADMEAFAKLIQPGPEHREFARSVGTWDMEVTMFVPGGEPVKSKGKAVQRMALGGRFLVADLEGSTPMGPYEGMSITGYDNGEKVYVMLWMDSMGTGVLSSKGTLKEDGAIEYVSEPYADVAAGGKKMIFRMVTKIVSDDRLMFTMFAKPADGSKEEAKIMESVSTRVKE